MKRLTKKLVAAVLAVTLVIGTCTTSFAASWDSYFGATAGWYEGAEGALSGASDTGWTATMTTIGYGGVWGAKVFNQGISVKKGQQYTLSFTMTSSNCDKWVYIKLIAAGAPETALAYGDWVQLKKGVATTYNKTFTAAYDATDIYFAMGGEFCDRSGVSTDGDADIRYSKLSVKPDDGDSSLATKIEMKNFKLAAAVTKPAKVTLSSVKGAKGKVTVKFKKVAGAKGYQVKYTIKGSKAKTKTTKKTTYKIKAKKGKKVTVQVRAYNASKEYGAWSKKKSAKAK